MIEEKILKAVETLNEKKLQKYISKGKFDKAYVKKQLVEMLGSERVENLKLAAKYELIEPKSRIMEAYRFVDAVERKDLKDIKAYCGCLGFYTYPFSDYFKTQDSLHHFFDKCYDIILRAAQTKDSETIYAMLKCDTDLRLYVVNLMFEWHGWDLLCPLLFKDLYNGHNLTDKIGDRLYDEIGDVFSTWYPPETREQDMQKALERVKTLIKRINNKAILREALDEAAQNNCDYIAKVLIDCGVSGFRRDQIKKFVESNNYKMLFMVMRAGDEITLDEHTKPSVKMQKFLEVYEKPESFLTLDLILTEEELKQFKAAAKYGLLKRHKSMETCEKTENYKKQNAELVKSIEERAENGAEQSIGLIKKITEKAQQIEIADSNPEKQKEIEQQRETEIINAINGLSDF